MIAAFQLRLGKEKRKKKKKERKKKINLCSAFDTDFVLGDEQSRAV